MTNRTPVISIIIPAKNGAPRINLVLESIFTQECSFQFEVIVIDSGSGDETMEIVRRYPVRLYEIPPEEFSHSRTRNYGASLALASRYLVFLNQDAVPSDNNWLVNLVRSIEFVPGIKAVCATELVQGIDYFCLSGVASYVFRTANTLGVHIIEPRILERLSLLPKWQQRELFPFTTVCAIFDKRHFIDHPFDVSVPWGEDLHWAVRNSREGYASGCTSLARVYHHHDYTETELQAIMAHTATVYQDLFDWSPPEETEPAAELMVSLSCDPRLQAVLNSLSWKITVPLRKVHSFLLRFCGR